MVDARRATQELVKEYRNRCRWFLREDYLDGPAPDASELGARWHTALAGAATVCDRLPPGEVGTCVVTSNGELFRGDLQTLDRAIAAGDVAFHEGRIGGSWPRPPRG